MNKKLIQQQIAADVKRFETDPASFKKIIQGILRINKKITQEKLAAKLGITEQRLNEIMKG